MVHMIVPVPAAELEDFGGATPRGLETAGARLGSARALSFSRLLGRAIATPRRQSPAANRPGRAQGNLAIVTSSSSSAR